MNAFFGGLLSLVTLVGLALALNINNSIAIGALTLRAQDPRTGLRMRVGGLLLSLVARLILVMVLAASLRPEFHGLLGIRLDPWVQRVCGLAAGLVLLLGAGFEMVGRLRTRAQADAGNARPARPLGVLAGMALVMVVDISLSFDSLIVVAGMASHPAIMAAVVVVEVAVILCFAEAVARVLRRYPTLETLCIAALLLMGGDMILRAAGRPLPEAVIYAMIGFALVVELLDMRIAAVTRRHASLHRVGPKD